MLLLLSTIEKDVTYLRYLLTLMTITYNYEFEGAL